MPPFPGNNISEVTAMKKKEKRAREFIRTRPQDPDPRLCPQERMCPNFDDMSITMQKVAKPGEMGMRVLDNFCEEHIM